MTDSKPLAVVTGASSGIGRELARQFATNGFDVIAAAEDTGLVSAVEDLAATGAQIQPVRADLALHYELKDTGVTVTALLPGPTDTGFFERAGMKGTPVDSSARTTRPTWPGTASRH